MAFISNEDCESLRVADEADDVQPPQEQAVEERNDSDFSDTEMREIDSPTKKNDASGVEPIDSHHLPEFVTYNGFRAIVRNLKRRGKLPHYFDAKDLWTSISVVEEFDKMRQCEGEPGKYANGLKVSELIPLIQIEFTTQCLGLCFTLDEALEFSKQARRIASFTGGNRRKPRTTLDVSEFTDAWIAANGSKPSAKLVRHICSIFPHGKIEWQLFTHACQADPLSADNMSFPTSLSNRLSRNRTNAMSYLVCIPTLVVYFCYLFLITQGEAINISESLRNSFAPQDAAYDRTDVEAWLTGTLQGIWGEDESVGPRSHSNVNFFVGALRIMQWRVESDSRGTCENYYKTYFGSLSDVGNLRAPDYGMVDSVRAFYNSRVADDFPGVYQMLCVSNWNGGKHEAKHFSHSGEQLNVSTLSERAQHAFHFRQFGTAAGLSTTHGHDDQYPAEGFFIDIPYSLPYSDASALLAEVLGGGWVDANTRMVVARAVTYNHNLQMAAAMRIGFELSSGGSMAPVSHMDILPIRESDDAGLDTTTSLLLVFAALYGIRNLQKMFLLIRRRLRMQSSYHLGISILTEDFTEWMGILMHSLFVNILLITTIWRVVWWVNGSLPSSITIDNNGQYPEVVEYNALLNGVLRVIEGTNYLLLTILCTIFITESIRFEVILETISCAYGDLIAIGTLFIIVVVAFTCATQLLWGYDLDSMFSFHNAFLNMFIGATGGGGIPEDAFESRPDLAPIFQIFYVVISSIILCNTVTGILTDALSTVKENKYDSSLTDACYKRYGTHAPPYRHQHSWARRCFNFLVVRSLIGSIVQIAYDFFITLTTVCGGRKQPKSANDSNVSAKKPALQRSAPSCVPADEGRRAISFAARNEYRDCVLDHFRYSIYAYWSSMEKWWLMIDCGTPSEAAVAGAMLFSTRFDSEVAAELAASGGVNLIEERRIREVGVRLAAGSRPTSQQPQVPPAGDSALSPARMKQALTALAAARRMGTLPRSVGSLLPSATAAPPSLTKEAVDANNNNTNNDDDETSGSKRSPRATAAKKETIVTFTDTASGGPSSRAPTRGSPLTTLLRPLFSGDNYRNRFVVYGAYRRLPVWEELLFNRFEDSDGSTTYEILLHYFILIPAILFGQDEAWMGMAALEQKHYYDNEQRAFGAHLKDKKEG